MSTSPVVECTACGNQHRRHETDASHCPDCGGECHDLSDIYGPEGEAWNDSNSIDAAQAQGEKGKA